MRKELLISGILLVLFTACEKTSDVPYTLKFYGDAFEDIGYSVAILSDGYVIAGQLTDISRKGGNFIESSNVNMGILKVNWKGDKIWKTSAGGKYNDKGLKILPLSEGSMICVGSFTDTTTALPGKTDIFVVKLSSAGEIIWQRTYGGQGNQSGTDIIKTPDGFMILGSTDVERQPLTDSTGNISGRTDILILKINNNGDFIESFAYGYPGNDIGSCIKPDIDGNYIIFGTTDRSDPGQAKNNLILIRINSVGYATESKIIGGTDDEYSSDMEVLSDGYLITGTVGKEGENQYVYVSKLDKNIYASSVTKMSFQINGKSTSIKAISKYKNGSFVLAGQSGTGSSADLLIFEMDADGNRIEGNVMIKGSTGMQVAYDVVSGADGYIIAVGKNSSDVNSMITFLKFMF
jgi:hypothetical protein